MMAKDDDSYWADEAEKALYPKKEQTHLDSVYLDADPFGGDMDTDVTHYSCKLLTTRTSHTCCGGYGRTEHTIQAGTRVFFEKCFLDGKPATSYFCLECFDVYLDQYPNG